MAGQLRFRSPWPVGADTSSRWPDRARGGAGDGRHRRGPLRPPDVIGEALERGLRADRTYWLVVLIEAGSILLVCTLMRSRTGQSLTAIRDSDSAAAYPRHARLLPHSPIPMQL